MKKIRIINELFTREGTRLGALKAAQKLRTVVLQHVIVALSPEEAAAVVSAGIEGDELTIGVNGGVWATRLRYVADALRIQVGQSLGVELTRVRIKVVRPLL